MSVSSITRRKLLLLSKERSSDFKQHLSGLTTTEREDLYDFIKGRYILKRNTVLSLTLISNMFLFQNNAVGTCIVLNFSAAFYIGIIKEKYTDVSEMIDEVESKKD